jgi:hypothetical protein
MTFLIYDSRCDQLEVTYHYHRSVLEPKMPLAQRGQSFEPLHPKGPEFLRPYLSLSDVKWVPLGLANAKGDERLLFLDCILRDRQSGRGCSNLGDES